MNKTSLLVLSVCTFQALFALVVIIGWSFSKKVISPYETALFVILSISPTFQGKKQSILVDKSTELQLSM